MWQAKWQGSRSEPRAPSAWAGPVEYMKGTRSHIYEWHTPVSKYVDAMSPPRPTRHRGTTIPLPTASTSGSDSELYAPSPSQGMSASSTPSYSPLNPPRPAHLANTRNRRSWSAADTLLDVSSSDSQRAPTPPNRTNGTISPPLYVRAHSSASKYASVEPDTPPVTPAVAAVQIYTDPYPRGNATPPPDGATLQRPSRAPPSAFHFPSQVYGGNTDPSPSAPGLGYRSGRSSTESLHGAYNSAVPASSRPAQALSSQGSHNMLRASPEGGSWVVHDLEPPYPPFMAQSNGSQPPNNSGTTPFRAPFLSPASRPSSLIWSPPSNPNHSHTALTTIPSYAGSEIPPKAPLPSTLLSEKLTKEDKPWLTEAPDARTRASRWISLLMILLGAGGAGLLCWTGYQDAGRTMIDSNRLCLVMEDTFDNLDVDNGGTWTRDVEMSGFGYVSYIFT
jgi:hypothetical protein